MLLAAASVLTLNAAAAQDESAAAGSTALEAVVVEGGGDEKGGGPVQGYAAKKSLTGTKTDTPVAKTPQTIAVVPKEQIQNQNAFSVAESLRYTPGVVTEYRGASNLRDEMFVRGFYYVPKYLGGDLSYARSTLTCWSASS